MKRGKKTNADAQTPAPIRVSGSERRLMWLGVGVFMATIFIFWLTVYKDQLALIGQKNFQEKKIFSQAKNDLDKIFAETKAEAEATAAREKIKNILNNIATASGTTP